jgi:hypothetical protein
MGVFENRVLMRIDRPEREEVTGCQKLNNKKLHSLYPSPNIVLGWSNQRGGDRRVIARMTEIRNVYQILRGKSGGKRLFERDRCELD